MAKSVVFKEQRGIKTVFRRTDETAEALGEILISQSIKKGTVENSPVVADLRRRSVKVVRDWLQATLESVDDILAAESSPGFGNIRTKQRRTIQANTPDKPLSFYAPSTWEPLSRRYAKYKKRKRFWAYEGYTSQVLGSNRALVEQPDAVKLTRKKAIVRARKAEGLLKLQYAIKIAAIQEPLNTYIIESFVTGVPHNPQFPIQYQSQQVTPRHRMVFAESKPEGGKRPQLYRPFISTLSAKMGEEMVKHLRKVK